MNNAAVSGDIISFTALSQEAKKELHINIKKFIEELTEKYQDINFFGRIVQGDYIECAMENPRYALRIALLLKTFIKSLDLPKTRSRNHKLKYFREHALRLAVAVAPLTAFIPSEGIIDGEAIYLSGRAIKNLSTSDKQKTVIKNTLFFRCMDENVQEEFETIFSLLDWTIGRCSGKQSAVVYYKLMGFSEKEIGMILNKSQSTISQHSTAAGWQAIEKSVEYFEKKVT